MNAITSTAPEKDQTGNDKAPLLLEVKNLLGGYGDIPVLRGVSLTVHEGEAVGLLGHNGMGKSTLLKTIMGFLPATGGAVIFDGEDITKSSPHLRARAGLGYVPQGRGIFSQLSVLDNLRFAWPAETGGTADEAVERLLGWFPRLTRLLDRQGGALSGGEQQLLALARCLIAEPLMMLLDEPTEGIQPSIIEEIEETLNTIRRETNLTILVVEQNLEFLSAVSSRLMILERGAITGEVPIDAAVNPALIEEFVGFGAARQTSGRVAAPANTAPAVPSSIQPAASEHLSFTKPNATTAKPSPIHPMPGSTPPAPLREAYMTVRRPTLDQMRGVVGGLGMSMSDREIMDYMTIMEGTLQAYDRVDALPDNLPQVKYPRTPGRRPNQEENPLNAWYIKTDIRGAPSGPLEGKRVALKDNVCLAGVPMMNGASTLEGYTPDIDATIVTRILDAGGTIVGKAHCEYFCLSGGSHTNATGPVHNPYKLGHTAGGSSSGSGALVGLGEVEMAIGGDQGGSIRIPASFCGGYGMKPTHGLVPYTGIMPIEPTIDHTGPMTTNVEDNALLLEVLAGEDGLDPRQYAPKIDKYLTALGRGVAGLRIGLVREGFGLPNSEADVDAKVRQAAETFRRLGAMVEEISVPIHLDGTAIWTPIALEGLTDIMMHGNGFATGWEGLYMTSLLDHHANWRSRADELSPSLKISMFIGEYMLKHHRGHYYAKAQNLSRRLKQDYDQVLQRYDLLMMPTLPLKAPPLPGPDAPLSLYIQRAFEMISNTAPFDATGHPAMSIPCGMSEGLPIGLQLIGKHYDESTIYRAAHAFEQAGDWKSM
ncbi:amidase [Denitrobaculum tricleocarpae]|uniref:Amidase n=1 Tax=Denitrobaculum tricleocarpae TaxID=2591009 RepID=A0A545TEV1_9PROT|nr:amidase [Denitrobaculum tricleocarpae]TQV75767.1 amidase [Denitrobaculum tricleocarpae]